MELDPIPVTGDHEHGVMTNPDCQEAPLWEKGSAQRKEKVIGSCISFPLLCDKLSQT